jgi:serine/threonine protein kinase/tetratricopeptide (TPR) repeat protein
MITLSDQRASAAASSPALELDDFVRAFEVAHARDGRAELADFLPAAGHPLRGPVLRELVRVDLEFAWKCGEPRGFEEYQRQYPDLANDSSAREEIAFETSRLRALYGPCAPRSEQQIAEPRTRLTPRRAAGAGVSTPETPTRLVDRARHDPFDLPSADIDFLASRKPCDAEQVLRPHPMTVAFPEVGDEFVGFQLREELGRGAFGRVYLAQQGDLANRLVALKVSTQLRHEPQTLAQLQHTNIVPIYSVHEAERLQAVCMPYLGATTLADVLREVRTRSAPPESGKGLVSTLHNRKSQTRSGLRSGPTPATAHDAEEAGPLAPRGRTAATLKMLEGYTYVEAVLWLGARLADGLAHAHERGILHRDLKPANILLTDDGQPMLLDFNLSADVKEVGDASAALVGGTLPYMAPEHIEAFRGARRPVDARSDLFALGIILYEMVSGRHPYPCAAGPLSDVVDTTLAARRQPPPGIRRFNPAVSPAAESIVHHCLQPDPARRYQSAQELREDLDRHHVNLPLKYAPEPSLRERLVKFRRRHPRLLLCSVATLAVVVITALAASFLANRARLVRVENITAARDSYREFRDELVAVQSLLTPRKEEGRERVREGIDRGQTLLAVYQAGDNPEWDREPKVALLGEDEQKHLRDGVTELAKLVSQAQNQHAAGEAEVAQMRRLGLNRLLAREYIKQGDSGKALPLAEEATRQDPRNYWGWYLLGNCSDGVLLNTEAIAAYSVCVALAPGSQPAYFNRGLAYLRHNDFRRAAADFGEAIRLRPDEPEGYAHRAMARRHLKLYAEALTDLDRAIERDADSTRLYFLRSQVREQAGDKDGAARDHAEGLRHVPRDEPSWIARGLALKDREPEAALADFDEALKLNPQSVPALQNKIHVLSEKLGRLREAVTLLDQAVALSPEHAPFLGGRGVLRARLGDRNGALADAEAALHRERNPFRLYQVACIYALTSRQEAADRWKAYDLLAAALKGGFGLDLLATDDDLDPLRQQPEFKRLVEAATAINTRGKAN